MNNNLNRLLALDCLRGLTIAFMIIVNTPGSWSYIYSPLRHAKWHGCTPTDLVFPFFLFIVGVAMRFSFKQYNYEPAANLIKKVFWRTVTIFAFGLMLNAYPFIRQDWDWSSLRIMGVLQRIGLAYGLASIISLYIKDNKIWIPCSIILIGYWFILFLFGGNDPYGLNTNVVRTIDIALMGEKHLWLGNGVPFDPEGLLSTLPATVTVLIGYYVGILIQENENQSILVKSLVIHAAQIAAIGWIWGFFFPINKPLWTSSYVLYTAGIATFFLALFIFMIDIKNYRKPFWPLMIFGTNSIFVFIGSGIWVKTIINIKFIFNGDLISGYHYLYSSFFQPLAGNINGSLLFALSHVLAWWLILYWLYRKRIFLSLIHI